MTQKEAIKILNPDADVVWKAYDGKDLERCNEACRVACVALAKQIPKKLLPPPNEDDLMFGFCPNCKEEIYCSCSELSHCCKCGQAFDWSDK